MTPTSRTAPPSEATPYSERRKPSNYMVRHLNGALPSMTAAVAVIALVTTTAGSRILSVIAREQNGWESLQAIVTILGISLGAWWFLTKRQRYPRADLIRVITHRAISPALVWLRVEVKITNRGDVILPLRFCRTAVLQLVPLTPEVEELLGPGGTLSLPDGETEIDLDRLAPQLREYRRTFGEIEPGETDSLFWDFFISSSVQTIRVRSFLLNEAKREKGEFGWRVDTVYEVGSGAISTPGVLIPAQKIFAAPSGEAAENDVSDLPSGEPAPAAQPVSS